MKTIEQIKRETGFDYFEASSIAIRNSGRLFDDDHEWTFIEVLNSKTKEVITSGDVVSFHVMDEKREGKYPLFRIEMQSDGLTYLYSAIFYVEISYHNEIDIYVLDE